jgi:glucosamine--fructose-6-phosphate aminotransferase (isomerizing)
MHGPLALAAAAFPVFVFAQADEAEGGLLDLAETLRRSEVPVIVAGRGAPPGTLWLPLAPGVEAHSAPLALIQSFYPLAEAVARARGRDPDRPPHLSKVTETL